MLTNEGRVVIQYRTDHPRKYFKYLHSGFVGLTVYQY